MKSTLEKLSIVFYIDKCYSILIGIFKMDPIIIPLLKGLEQCSNLKLTKVTLQIGCSCYHQSSLRKSALI